MKGPLFIVGTPRSGTTLLSVILNRHSKVWIDETSIGRRIFLCVDKFRKAELSAKEGQEGVAAAFQDIVKRDWKGNLYNVLGKYPAWDGKTTISSYLQNIVAMSAADHGKTLWGDKTPGLLYYTEYIYALFPDAKVIQVVRDGRASVSSLKDRQYTNLTLGAWRWKADLNQGIGNRSLYGEDRYMLVRYEDIVGEGEKTLQKICAFAGLDFEVTMMDLASEKVSKDSYIGNKLDNSKVNTWKKSLSEKEIKIIERMNGKVLKSFGYELVYPEFDNSAEVVSPWKLVRANFTDNMKILFRSKRMFMSKREWKEIRIPFKQRLYNFSGSMIGLFFSDLVVSGFKPKRNNKESDNDD